MKHGNRDRVRRKRRNSAEEQQDASLDQQVQQRNEELLWTNRAQQAEVAKRWRAGEALADSEEMLWYAALAAGIGMWHYDLITGDLVWNDRCKELFGYPSDFAMTYQAFLDAIAEEDRHSVDQAVQNALQEKSEYAVELRVMMQDGQVRWILCKGHAFYDAQGKPLRMAGIALDITQRKKTEAALLRAKEEWERTFNSVPDLIAILDEECRIVRVNEAVAQRINLEADRCVGLFCYQVLHGLDAPPDFCPHGQSMADKMQHIAEVYDPHLAGTFLVSTTPLISADGKSMGTVHVSRDITERKKAEEEIARLNADLEAHLAELGEMNQELDAFNHMISHDLRQPLNVMSLACQHIEMFCSSDNPECRCSIHTLEQSVVRMNGMIETLLSFSCSTHGTLSRQECDMSELVQVILAELNLAEPARRITTVIPQGIKVNADPRLLRTALENLLGNAWKYTGGREQACIEFGGIEGEVKPVYFIKDNGVGFNMAEADKLFVPFKRLAGVDGFKGSGIGLATVEKIIKRHGGRIWAEGESDRGAAFYFTLES
ncbi:histidine kinase [Geoanaerobacter pelophilus]|uniref:histidine kinase n=1 Tax=Geoanaerobacter pelophilus TaxID=60036 RepID=A0ABQ0MGZ1_9BACT|nr:PAS domain S-box protein [Geoanaerobacter pelophilus]GAW66370.1 histidine kinase [Geoanaerobacter pelophilus]